VFSHLWLALTLSIVYNRLMCRAHVPRLEWKGDTQVPVCQHCGAVVQLCTCINDDEPDPHCSFCSGTGWVLNTKDSK